MSGPGFTQPDLCSIRAATGQAESADAVRGLLSADGYSLASDYPLGSRTCNVARTLAEVGFTLHHRDRYRLRGGQRTEAGR